MPMMTAISSKGMPSKLHHHKLNPLSNNYFPRNRSMLTYFDSQPIQTLRELKMLKVMEGITDIPDWYKQASRFQKSLPGSTPLLTIN